MVSSGEGAYCKSVIKRPCISRPSHQPFRPAGGATCLSCKSKFAKKCSGLPKNRGGGDSERRANKNAPLARVYQLHENHFLFRFVPLDFTECCTLGRNGRFTARSSSCRAPQGSAGFHTDYTHPQIHTSHILLAVYSRTEGSCCSGQISADSVFFTPLDI